MSTDISAWRDCWLDHRVNQSGVVIRVSDSKIIPFNLTASGYLFVNLYNLSTRPQRVHRLVAQAFVENPLNKPCVNHKDGEKLHNHYTNLEWVTHEENMQHAAETGLTAIGAANGNSDFTEEDVIIIKSALASGIKTQSVAEAFGVPYSTIQAIKSNTNWKHVPWPEDTTKLRKGFSCELNPAAKLDLRRVAEIRELFSDYGNSEIASHFGVNRKTIADIRDGKTWKVR